MNSWHDSDDVDSDIECEAYNMLYHDLHNENIKNNLCVNEVGRNIEDYRISGSDSNSETHLEDNFIILTDSDDSFVKKKITCSNKVPCLSVGLSSDSDDSDYNKINDNMIETTNESFILNMNNSSYMDDNMIHSSITQNGTYNDWSVDNVDFEPRSKYRNRYFNDNRSGVCEMCLKKGHSKIECTRVGPACILCGKEGHISNDCNDLICHVCFQSDHLTKKCTKVTEFYKNTCRRCGQRGHTDYICPDVWRQYKYTTSSGHPIQEKFPSQTSSWTTKDVLCANCGRVGHYTDNCPKNRMSSRFIGPAPIMEIVQFDTIDIYKSSGLTYTDSCFSENIADKLNEDVDSMIMNMDVNGIMKDVYEENIIKNDSLTIDESDDKKTDFGNGYIMLSPIVKAKLTNDKSVLNQTCRDNMKCSTPGPQMKPRIPLKIDKELMESVIPILPESFLKKLFPAETENIIKLTPGLRSKLKKKIRKLSKKGYFQGDSQMTQDQMDCWLQDISKGRFLNYKEEDTKLANDSALCEAGAFDDIGVITDVPESRRKKNKALRQIKRFQNELKVLQRDNNSGKIKKDESVDSAAPFRTRLRKRKSIMNSGDINEEKKLKLRQPGGNVITGTKEESCCA